MPSAFSSVNASRSLPEVHASVSTTSPSLFRRMFAFAGPAYLVSVGYMDPGNWATDLEGGARFGYQLLWVLVMSNLMAILLQTLAARLGVVVPSFALATRDRSPRARARRCRPARSAGARRPPERSDGCRSYRRGVGPPDSKGG